MLLSDLKSFAVSRPGPPAIQRLQFRSSLFQHLIQIVYSALACEHIFLRGSCLPQQVRCWAYLKLSSLSGQCLLRVVVLLLQLLCKASMGFSHCSGLVSFMLLLQLPPELSYCLLSCCLLCVKGLTQPLSFLSGLCKLALKLLALLLCLLPPSTGVQMLVTEPFAVPRRHSLY